MKNLLLTTWQWLNEDGKPGSYMWATLIIIAVVVFTALGIMIWRLGNKWHNKIIEKSQTSNVNNIQVEPMSFEKRSDNQLEFYDPIKAQEEAAKIEEQNLLEQEKRQKEEEHLQALMLETERKSKELEAKEREFEEKRQHEEEVRLEREREEAERAAEKELTRAAKNNNKNGKEVNDFFALEDDNASGFVFNQDDTSNKNDETLNFWNQASNSEENNLTPVVSQAPVTDPRLEKMLAELESQKQAEQERFANLMAELESQKQETARLQNEIQSKEKSEDLIAQVKKEMEQMIKDSQDQMNNIEKQEKTKRNDEMADKELLEEIRNILASEREAQEQRLREQENSLAAVLTAMENERRAKEENAINAEKEAEKEDEFTKMQMQYQEAISQMQEKFQKMLDEANTQKQTRDVFTTENQPNEYQLQIERERAETTTLIEQMQREVDRMNSEREAERREYEEKQRALDDIMAEALQTQRNEFEQAQQRVSENNMSNVEKILQNMEAQRAQEQEMFNNILSELVAERKDNNQAKTELEQIVKNSEERIAKLETQPLPRGLDEETMQSLKNILASERKAQEEKLEEYRNEIVNLREMIAKEHDSRKNEEDDSDDSNQIVYEAKVSDVDNEMNARIEAMQNEIQHLNDLRDAERAESEKRHTELLEALNRTIITGENAQTPETQQIERESVERVLNDIEQQNRAEQDKFADIMNELIESREDTKKAQAAMQQLIEENSALINRLNNKQEIRGVDEETMSALKDLLAHEREMQEKRLAEHEEKLNMAVSTIEEQKQSVVDEQNKQAEYEQIMSNMREQYESELENLRATVVNQQNALEESKSQNEINNRNDDESNKVTEAVMAQLAQMQENIVAIEEARNAERAEFEQRYDEMNKVLEDSLKVQRLEMELAKEREINELKMQQALKAQRDEIEAEKEQALAEQRAELKPENNESTDAVIASFKEEMNRQYEEFVKLLNDKKVEEENARKEFDEVLEKASEADQAALKEQQFDVQEMMEQLREERKAAREEAQALREELEAQRMETEAKLMKQLSEVKEGLASELSSELEIKEKYEAMERELEAQNQEKIQQSEAEEARIKKEYEEFKQRIADEVVALEEKNAMLQEELEKARAEKNIDDENKQAEYDENEKRLREKYMQLRTELMKEAEQVNKKSEEIAAEKQAIEDKKNDLEEEKVRLQNEVELLKKQVLEIKTQDYNENGSAVAEEQIAEIRATLEAEYQQREKEMLDKLEKEKQSLVAREIELKQKEENIALEETRIREQSKAVTTMITNREYTTEERERLVLDYNMKLQDLEERLRQNEKALRENNREFIPLRRIKSTLDRDLRLLRKREAIVAKQEVLVYGVNNISNVEPERIQKLEQDIKQLSGLQQSVANCETILNKNKDRYPTLENLDRVLRAQNEQIRRDIDEVKSAMAMFGESDSTTGDE